jgi:hypothetical protein
MSDDIVPADWYALATKHLEILAGKRVLAQQEGELQVIDFKRGSRRWLPPRDEA